MVDVMLNVVYVQGPSYPYVCTILLWLLQIVSKTIRKILFLQGKV